MSKFNTGVAPVGRGVIMTSQKSDGLTHQGGPGFSRDVKSELFLLAVTNFVGEKTFYEKASDRDDRFIALVRTVRDLDPDWLRSFGIWLRTSANMRSAPLMLAAETYKANAGGDRALVSGVCQRADEPGEMIAYWHARYGKSIPVGMKRGLADAATRLYTQNAALKYDPKDKRSVKFADVVALTHAKPKDERQNDLFTYLLGKRKGLDVALPESLKVFKARHDVTHGLIPATTAELARAGMTWEALSGIEQGEWDAKKWESVIPSMGYMALLRNLANFDKAGVSPGMRRIVADKLADPDNVHMSKQLPMRFLSALRAVPSYSWHAALEQALDASVAAIPSFSGSTLILVDTSGSMNMGFSKDGSLMRWDAAALFGLALAQRCEYVDVYSYSSVGYGNRDLVKKWPAKGGLSLAKSLDLWKSQGYFIGSGTDTTGAVRATYSGHDRVVILTDEQSAGGGHGCGNPRCTRHGSGTPGEAVPANVPLHTFNLAGYKMGHTAGAANRYTYGGLTDACFGMMKLVEAGASARWPWETTV